MEQLLRPPAQIQGDHGGKSHSKTRDETDIGSSPKVRHSDDAKFSFACWLLYFLPQSLKYPNYNFDDDGPLGWIRPLVRVLVVIFLGYLTLPVLVYNLNLSHEGLIIMTSIVVIVLSVMLVSSGFFFAFPLVSICGILSTVYTAWVCGCEVAKDRQCRGDEKSAEIAFSCSKIGIKKIDPILPFFMLCILSLSCAVRVVWMCHMAPEDPIWAIMDVSIMVTICMFAWTWFVNCVHLYSALFNEQDIGMGFVSGVILLFMLMFVVAILFGETISTIIPWIGAMLLSGLYGYTYEVFCNYRILK